MRGYQTLSRSESGTELTRAQQQRTMTVRPYDVTQVIGRVDVVPEAVYDSVSDLQEKTFAEKQRHSRPTDSNIDQCVKQGRVRGTCEWLEKALV